MNPYGWNATSTEVEVMKIILALCNHDITRTEAYDQIVRMIQYKVDEEKRRHTQ